ncbi:MAG TPA: sigma-54 dependent transcriptional regulator [Pyrinomonadaceae bacterium]|nr:sigma-54 dependent transcriptional regulator [Pyrinomonadaceae bacterium]
MTEQPQVKGTVLVVDDDDAIRSGLYWALSSEYRVLQASSREEATRLVDEQQIDVVVTDLHLPPRIDDIAEGLALIEAARSPDPPLQVVVITGSDARRASLEAVSRGAYGFFEKPLDPDEVLHIVNQAARLRKLEIENRRLRNQLGRPPGFSNLFGTSQALENVLKQARSVATTTATVLLTGENGTGKEMLARAIHAESARSAGPFVAVSCAALPETLIESELFGHEKGAFTNATQSRKGRFELADGGTLFLDEVGELSPAIQVKLLRVLQERAFERVGGTKTLTVDIRLIAASNRDLEKEVEESRFRQDLFYRLNVVPLLLPPLRERQDDIPMLAAHFAEKAAQKHSRPTPQIDPILLDVLQDYEWPGNVRELENLIERLVVLERSPCLGLEFVPEKMLRSVPLTDGAVDESSLEGAVIALKRRMIVNALNAENGNKVAAAKRLGISRSYLHRLINEFDL